MKIVFNSSLPRSGSTLLQNILAQNPEFYCTPTSGLLELLYGARTNFANCLEFKTQDQRVMDRRFRDFCNHSIHGWYENEEMLGKLVVVDKSRGWIAYYDWLKSFYKDPKIIVCIRDLRGIFASMEKLWRANQNRVSFGENPGDMKFLTVDARVSHWMTTPPIGLALSRLADAIQRGNDKNFLFVRFEDLTSNPTAEIDRIYQFIGQPRFEHDLFDVVQSTHEDDSIHGIPDLHTIRPEVKPVEKDWDRILGKELSQLITVRHRWFYEKFYPELS